MVADIDLDASEILALLPTFEKAEREATNKAYGAVKGSAMKLRDQWKRNARASSGTHGRRYPKAITAEQIPLVGAIEWEVGPESLMPQGGMGKGFEYGSVNQPPHLDGAQAVTKVEPLFVAALEKIMGELL